MTFFGYDIDESAFAGLVDENVPRYVISPNLLKLFDETDDCKLPLELVKAPYDRMFIEINDRIIEDLVICGIVVIHISDEKLSEVNEYIVSNGNSPIRTENIGFGVYRLIPIYKAHGATHTPTYFDVTTYSESKIIRDVNVEWGTVGETNGLFEDHPLVKTASVYCWMVVVMVCIYVTLNDADIILGIETKEYKKISKKKKPKQSKLRQLRSTKYLGNNIKIDRKLELHEKSNLGGTHASPCPHWRTGHFRHLKNGKIVWIKPCIIGFGNQNRIPPLKKYLLQ